MNTPQLRAIVAGAGLASATIGTTPVIAKTAAPLPDWNDQISAVKLGTKVRIIAYEHGQFEGASIVLDGSTSTSEFPNLMEALNAGAKGQNWNNRISSIKVVAVNTCSRSASSDENLTARFYQNTDFGGAELSVKAGTEIADLVEWQSQLSTVPMTVHEWGTFTVLQGSNGRPIEWYQAPKDIVDLPAFVGRAGAFSKSGNISGLDLVRMETPVLYFYPESDKAVDITVGATFKDGRITEVFPPAYLSTPSNTVWQGTLFPPDSPELKKVPAAAGPRGRHYAAARAVPDAWLFRGKEHPNTLEIYNTLRKADPKHHMLPTVDPVDHFIFYRGAGNPGRFGIYAKQDLKDPNKYTLRNSDKATVPKLFALRIRDGKSSWITVNNLEHAKYDRTIKATVNEQSLIFPEASQTVSEVAEQLRTAMISTLVDEGLTKHEAAAMVATWDDLWFTEPGTRVLAVLPESFADTMVPLEITPKPSKIDRVFVARIELINRDKEARLMALLNQPNANPGNLDKDAQQLVDIQLGRYSSGGMERAMELVKNQIRRRFHALDEAKPEDNQEATRVTLAR